MIVVLMGVAGSGKTTIGKLLARDLPATFLDADDYHSPEHIARMRRGIALTDEDRAPWLASLNRVLLDAQAKGVSVVLACSALKEAYRSVLLRDLPAAKLVYLRGSRSLVSARLAAREGHYMAPTLLDSQMQSLEEPGDAAIVADIGGTPQGIADDLLARLKT